MIRVWLGTARFEGLGGIGCRGCPTTLWFPKDAAVTLTMCNGICRVEDAATLAVLHDCRYQSELFCPNPACGVEQVRTLDRLLATMSHCVWCGTALATRLINPNGSLDDAGWHG